MRHLTNFLDPSEVLSSLDINDDLKISYFEELFGEKLTDDNVEYHFKKWRSNNIKSSNVKKMLYDDETFTLTVQFHDKSIYTYYNVSFKTYMKINNGEYSPRTTGSNEYGSWKKGVRPSTGAGIHQALIDAKVKYQKGGSFK